MKKTFKLRKSDWFGSIIDCYVRGLFFLSVFAFVTGIIGIIDTFRNSRVIPEIEIVFFEIVLAFVCLPLSFGICHKIIIFNNIKEGKNEF